MNINPETMTVAEFEAAVAKIVEEHPDYRNPYIGGAGSGPCYYQRNGRRCLIGYMLVEVFGAPYDPNWENHGAYFPMAALGFTEQVKVAALVLQGFADRQDPGTKDKVTWAEAWRAYQEYQR